MLLLTTKLYRPPVSTDLEPRTQVLERLDRNRQRPLTLISAPAGYGKTTLASMWLEASNCASAWVSLDEGDNDLGTFAGYLVAAVQRAFPDAKLETPSLLQTPVMPPVQVVARYLLNDLAQIDEPFIMALDDVYMIHEQVIFDLLNELLRHPSPNIHLLLITRRDPPLPIASLRARMQITEVRARDLRFTTQEAAQLLGKMLHRTIDEATAAEWTQRTEGWVTALQLAALSLRHRGQGADPHASIPADNRYLHEYLLAEVLQRLPPAKQEWLLAASLLDRFNASLCEAVCLLDAACDDEAFTGEEFIRWLQENNLFLSPLDDQYRWFRFHHLFQELLRQALTGRAKPDEIASMHRRASRWFDTNGLWDEALRHLVAAGETPAAVQFVIEHRYDLMNTQQWRRMHRWLRLLPPDAVSQSPHLMCTKSHLAIHAQSWRASEIIDALRQAERLLAMLPPDSETYRVLQGELGANRSLFDVAWGRPTQAATSAQQSLQVLPAQAHMHRTLAQSMVAGSLQMQGEYERGVDCMEETLASPGLSPTLRAYALHLDCTIRFFEGDLNGVVTSSHRCLRISEDLGISQTRGYARYNLGVAHYLRNELEEAEVYLGALFEDRATSPSSYVAYGAFALALIHASRGQWSEAEQVIELASTHLDELNDTFALAVARAFRVELALRKGDLDKAQSLRAGVDFDLRPPIWFFYVEQLTPIKLSLAEGTPEELDMAHIALVALDERMAAICRKAVRIDVLSLLALVCDAQGDTAAACGRLSEALHLAEPGGFIRNFVDLGSPMAALLTRLYHQAPASQESLLPFVTRILAALPKPGSEALPSRPAAATSPSPPAPPVPRETLTDREAQILKLLATELAPEEMARLLSISTSTVRTHIKNIYAKLEVHSRIAAVGRARGQRIL